MARTIRRRLSGFTLIEMLIVIIILGILLAIGIPAYLTYQSKAKDAAAKADLTTAFKALAATKTMNNGSFPTQSSMLAQARQDEPGMSYISGIASAASQGKINVSLTGTTLTLATLSKSGKIITLTATSGDNFSQPAYSSQAVPAGYAAAVMADSPLLYWRFNDSAGTTAQASAGANGTVGAGVSVGTSHTLTGGGNTAFSFVSGSSTSNVQLSAASAPSPSPTATIEFWIKAPAAVGTTGNILSKYLNSTGGAKVTGTTSGDINFAGSGNCAPGALDNTWHLIDVVITDNTGDYFCYEDGVQTANSSNSAAGFNFVGSQVLDVGYDTVNTQNALPMALDEVAIYPTALSPARVIAHWNAR